MPFNELTQDRRAFLRTAAAGVIASMFATRPAWAQTDQAINLDAWIWSPGYPELAEVFQESFPNVKLTVGSPAGSGGQLLKLRNALRANSGIPDIVELQQRDVATFSFINELADLTPYGVAELEDKFPAWLWGQSKKGDAVIALPNGIGPMAMLYRQDVFDEFGLTVPTTWDEFREQARKLKAQTSDHFMMDLNLVQAGGWATGLFWAAGSRPFKVDGANLHIDIDNEPSRKVAAFWDELLAEGLVEAAPTYTPEWFVAIDRGRYATYPVAAWINSLVRNGKEGVGKWRVAPLPQWDAANPRSGGWGGTSMAVMERSTNHAAAADYVKYVTAVAEAVELFITTYNVMPALNEMNQDPRYADREIEFLGGQKGNQVFIDALQLVDTSFEWSPINDFVETTMNDEFSQASGGNQSCVEALARCQAIVVGYAKEQGFSVTAP